MSMRVPAPVSQRQTFHLYHLYNPEIGLPSFVDPLDWAGVTPRQIFAAVVGRLPGKRDNIQATGNYSGKHHFMASLESAEFQDRIIHSFLNAFPEKTRYLFVHIPKCAGTDLETDLARHYPALPQSLLVPSYTSKRQLHTKLASLSTQILVSDAVLVCGHLSLRWYLDQGLYRFTDRIFAIVREPVGIILSLVNYIVTTMMDDPGTTRVDTADWRAVLDDKRILADLPREEIVQLARRILYIPALVERNILCSHLGEGTADSTLSPLAISNIELVDISRYAVWRRQSWRLPDGLHQNPSRPFFTRDDLLPADRDYIQHLTDEDRRLYGWITTVLERSRAPSFRGNDVVRAAARADK